ncbi:hypothetical protein KLAF111653_00570 [Klebsiella africana]|uniref:Uncharacterized protein n=1 Tax=Klebsiella africana TaxID=2489010 RepID=A0A8B6IMF2_9ENTR|nr:hypothetical protein SB5857_00784 [Klebsiella africana]
MISVMIPDISTSNLSSAVAQNITNGYECKYYLRARQMIFIVI